MHHGDGYAMGHMNTLGGGHQNNQLQIGKYKEKGEHPTIGKEQ